MSPAAVYASGRQAPEPLRPGLRRLRGELQVPDGFPAPVEAEAAASETKEADHA